MRRNYRMRRNYVIRMASTSCRGKGTCTTFDITEYCASCCVNLQKTVKRPPLSDGISEFRQPSLSLESQTKCFHSQVGCHLKKHNYNTPVRWLLLLLRYCLKWKYWEICAAEYIAWTQTPTRMRQPYIGAPHPIIGVALEIPFYYHQWTYSTEVVVKYWTLADRLPVSFSSIERSH